MAAPNERWQRLVALLDDHGFRARMDAEALAAQERELETVFKLYGYDEWPEGEEEDREDDDGQQWDASRFPGHLRLFRAIFKPLYYSLSALGRARERRRPKPAAGRHLCQPRGIHRAAGRPLRVGGSTAHQGRHRRRGSSAPARTAARR